MNTEPEVDEEADALLAREEELKSLSLDQMNNFEVFQIVK